MKSGTGKARIVVIGSINMDLVVACERVPRPGETIHGGDLCTFPGGKGANQAVAAARLGAEVHMVGCVGDDGFGRTMRGNLKENGVDVRFVRTIDSSATGTGTILVQRGGENSIVISPGANGKVGRKDIDAAMTVIRRADFVLLQLEIPMRTVAYAIEVCRRVGVRRILDPAPAPGKLPRGFFEADVMTPNEMEAGAILGLREGGSEKGKMNRLLGAGAKEVVLKLGKRGSMYGSNELGVSPIYAAGFVVKVVDTTAAGDCFNGAFAVARAEGMETGEALRFANAAGALTCTGMGAQPALPTREDVMKLIRRGKAEN